MVNSRDVAKLADVSIATVSRVFSDDPKVRLKTKLKVLKAAERLGYSPNLHARSLKNNKSGLIGIILDDSENVFYTVLTKHIEQYLDSYGYRLLLTYSNEDSMTERNCLETLLASRVEGIIFMPVSTKNADVVGRIRQTKTPILQCFRKSYSNLDSYYVDDEKGAYIATKHLLDNGHTNILVTDYGDLDDTPPKIKGYLKAFDDSGVTLCQDNIVKIPFESDSIKIIYDAIIKQNPTSIITLNSIMTASALSAFNQLRLKIPDDISIIAYDDNIWLTLLNITAITHPMDQIGKNIVNLLIGTLIPKDKEESEIITHYLDEKIDPSLTVRNSVKNLFSEF